MGDTKEFKQRFMKWELVETVLPRAGAVAWHTWLSLRPAATGPAFGWGWRKSYPSKTARRH